LEGADFSGQDYGEEDVDFESFDLDGGGRCCRRCYDLIVRKVYMDITNFAKSIAR
jgi:hypothetical protein